MVRLFAELKARIRVCVPRAIQAARCRYSSIRHSKFISLRDDKIADQVRRDKLAETV
jgi:hypothetical protein